MKNKEKEKIEKFLRKQVIKHHNLDKLIEKIIRLYT